MLKVHEIFSLLKSKKACEQEALLCFLCIKVDLPLKLFPKFARGFTIIDRHSIGKKLDLIC